MASIVNILGENALQLKQEEFVRQLSFGNNWNKIRIGMLCRVNDTVTIGSNPRFHIGMCNGTINTLASSACAGYMAVKPYGSQIYTYDGVNLRYSFGNNYFYSYYYKTGSSVTESLTAGFTGDSYMSAGSSAGLSMMVAQFVRTAANTLSVILFYVSAAQYTTGVPTTSDLYSVMEDENADRYVSRWMTVPAVSSLAGLSTGIMQMDSVSIYWNKTNPLEIGTLLVARYR